MESIVYGERELWNLHTEETKKWIGKHAVVVLKDGSSISGVIREVGCAANENQIDGCKEHLWVSIFIEKRISISKIESLIIEAQ